MIQPYYQDDAVTIYHGDCREIVPTLGRFDLLLTDPPYGIGMDTDYTKLKDSDKGVRGYGHLRKKHERIHGDDEPFDPTMWLEYPNVILWGANYFHEKLPKGKWLVWDKRADNGHAMFNDGEIAWFGGRSGVSIFDHCWHGFARSSENSEHYHPTQKPLALMHWCIGLAGDVQTILDPFAGSCTTARATKDLGRKCVCIEREERYCEIGARRMSQEVFDLT